MSAATGTKPVTDIEVAETAPGQGHDLWLLWGEAAVRAKMAASWGASLKLRHGRDVIMMGRHDDAPVKIVPPKIRMHARQLLDERAGHDPGPLLAGGDGQADDTCFGVGTP